jgi:hypothetical protein
MRPFSIAFAAASLICVLAAPAYALRPNTYVASYGADSGTCSYTAPCRTFTYALSQVQGGGVVTAIDSAGNSPFTIDKSVTITAPAGVSPSIQTPTNGIAITISAGQNDVVVLSGLTLVGLNSADGGILFSSGMQLDIVNCSIRGFISFGVDFSPFLQDPIPTSLLISNTIIADNASDGIQVSTSSVAPITATIDNVTLFNNSRGASLLALQTMLEALIKDSSIDNNRNTGIFVSGLCANVASASVALKSISLNETPNPIQVGECSSVYLSDVDQALAPPFAYNPGVTVSGQNSHVFSDGTNLTSAPPNSFQGWGLQ